MQKDYRLFLYDCKDGKTRPFKVPSIYFEELLNFGDAFMSESVFNIIDALTDEVRIIKGTFVSLIVKHGFELK
jgi:hypothetical protein